MKLTDAPVLYHGTVRSRPQLWLLVAVVAVLGLSGCGWPDRSRAAGDIDEAISAMPGVETTKACYDNELRRGRALQR